ncbi:uncharacterized protein LOC144125401 [Amblyomma americanum]
MYKVIHWDKFRDLLRSFSLQDDILTHVARCAEAATICCEVPSGQPIPDLLLLQLRAQRRQAERRALRTDRPEHWTLHNRLDAKGSARAWRLFRSLLEPSIQRAPYLAIAVAGGLTYQQLADKLAEALLPREPPPAGLHPRRHCVQPACSHAVDITAVCSRALTKGELSSALLHSKRRSAPGPDGVTYQMLRNLDDAMQTSLLQTYNEVWSTGRLPEAWRTALVVPVLKAGKPPADLLSYRPVSLTSDPGKLMESMALGRLEWIAAATRFLPEQQSGFRRHRCTADAIADIVSSLEDARHSHHVVCLTLLDVKGAFDNVYHEAILEAVNCLGVTGNLRGYIQGFLRDRTSCVRAGGATSTPQALTRGVPQGSVLSPMLFNLVMAQLPTCLPDGLKLPVRIAIYADDIALWCRGPRRQRDQVIKNVQRAITRVGSYLERVGLQLSPTKSEAMLLNIRPGARPGKTYLSVAGRELPWRHSCRYLGLLIDRHLTWRPAVKAFCRQATRVRGAIRSLLAGGNGITPQMGLRFFQAMAGAQFLYALPLVQMTIQQQLAIERSQRAAVRLCLGLPRGSHISATLAEAGVWPMMLQAQRTALRHAERLHLAPDGRLLLERLLGHPHSRMGKVAQEFEQLVGGQPEHLPSPPRPDLGHQFRVLMPPRGTRPKRLTPAVGLRQEAAATLEEDLAGCTQLYTDGSVLMGACPSAAAACTAPSLGESRQARLPFVASSTTAELAALHLAADILESHPALQTVAILSDSRVALQLLQEPRSRLPIVRKLAARLDSICSHGCSISLAWIPSHVGVPGNEEADALAKAAHGHRTPCSTAVVPLDVARGIAERQLLMEHPDPRVAQGKPPQRLPDKGITRPLRSQVLEGRIFGLQMSRTVAFPSKVLNGKRATFVPRICTPYAFGYNDLIIIGPCGARVAEALYGQE